MFAGTNRAIARELGGLYVSNLVRDRFSCVGQFAITGPLLLVRMIRKSTTASSRRRSALLHQLLRALLLQFVGLHRRQGLTWRDAAHRSGLKVGDDLLMEFRKRGSFYDLFVKDQICFFTQQGGFPSATVLSHINLQSIHAIMHFRRISFPSDCCAESLHRT